MDGKAVQSNSEDTGKRIRIDELNPESTTTSPQSTPHSTTPTGNSDNKNPFKIPELINHTFHYLDLSTLKLCRLVSSSWNLLSCPLLHSSPHLQIDIANLLPNQLADLPSYLDRPSSSIPTQNFRIRTNDFQNDHFYYILKSHGPKILRLHVKFDQVLHYVNQRTLGFMRSLLTKQAVHLQELHLELSHHMVVHDYGDSTRYRSKLLPIRWKTELPYLTRLIISNVQMLHIGADVIKEILEAAVNLKEFEATTTQDDNRDGSCRWLTIDYVNELVGTGRMDTVKKTSFAPAFPDDEEREMNTIPMGYTKKWRLEKFVQNLQPSTLTTLRIHCDEIYGLSFTYKENTGFLQKILDSCSQSLIELMLNPLEFLETLVFPVMTSVRKLSICTTEREFFGMTILPRDQKISRVFPNLREFVIEKRVVVEFMFQNEGKISTVKELKVCFQDWYVNIFLRDTGLTFDNLKRLTLAPNPGRRDLADVLQGVVKYFGGLQYLKLENFWIDSEDKEGLEDGILKLDSVITGIDIDELKGQGEGKEKVKLGLTEGIPGLTYFEMEMKIGYWSDFCMNLQLIDYPIFKRAVEEFGLISQVKIVLCGDLKDGEFGVTTVPEFHEGLEPLATLLRHTKPFVEVRLGKFVQNLPSPDEENVETVELDSDDEELLAE